MKKVVSVLLAVIFAFSALGLCASAVGDYQTYYMKYVIDDNRLHINALDGYTQYVLPGGEFKFTVSSDDEYTTDFTIVQVDGVDVDPDIHGVYTISDIGEDKTIHVYLTMDEGDTNLFSSIIKLVHDVIAWFKNIIEEIIRSNQT